MRLKEKGMHKVPVSTKRERYFNKFPDRIQLTTDLEGKNS